MQQIIDALKPFMIFAIAVWGTSEIIMMFIPNKKQRQKNRRKR